MYWEIKRKITNKKSAERRQEIISALLINRKLKTKKEQIDFFQPQKPQTITPRKVGINTREITKAISRIKSALKNKESIIVFGDYDADGICSTAILWEMLHHAGANALPFIPHREKHGYGLSVKGIQEILSDPIFKMQNKKPTLMITVDNGIVANQAVDYANARGIDVIVCDHHEKSKKLPKAFSIIHTTELSGSGVAWIFAKEISKKLKLKEDAENALDLATIGTVADMVPLIGSNRSIVKHGLQYLRKTKRPGLIKVFEEANVDPIKIDTYHINFIIAPRLNAMGRLEHGFESLKLLCTKSFKRAEKLARKIGMTNLKRQKITGELLEKAKHLFIKKAKDYSKEKIIIIDHQDFHEGVIGLIAGRIVEEYYKPAIIMARGKKYTKASARSIKGFNIIRALRKAEDLLVDIGGHPMAAGFTIESRKISSFRKRIFKIAKEDISGKTHKKTLSIDCEINLSDISWKFHEELKKFEPHGISNPKPVFSLENIKILESRSIGKENSHLKLILPSSISSQHVLQALWFNHGELSKEIPPEITLAFTLDENIWRGKRELQLKIKDLEADK